MTSPLAHLTSLAPQFLVDDLEVALAYYRDQLGFGIDFTYDDFYASVSRDRCTIHLKEAPKTAADRAHQRTNEHLDAHINVSGIRVLEAELRGRGARITRPLEERPWGVQDFYVEDPDGYILCFGEQNTGPAK